jgi:hypothetical protein
VDKDEAIRRALAALEQQVVHLVQLPRWALQELLSAGTARDGGGRGLELP